MMGTWLRRLVHLVWGSHAERDLREEIEAHRRLHQDRLEREGLSPTEAARASRRALGNVTLVRDDVRDVWIIRWLDDLLQDVRTGCRMLVKYRGVTAVAVLSLALGIGANTAAFSLFYAALLKPLPYADAERLVMIRSVPPGQPGEYRRANAPEYLAWTAQATVFDAMGTEGQMVRDLGADDQGRPAERVRLQRLTSGLFAVLGVQPRARPGVQTGRGAHRRAGARRAVERRALAAAVQSRSSRGRHHDPSRWSIHDDRGRDASAVLVSERRGIPDRSLRAVRVQRELDPRTGPRLRGRGEIETRRDRG